MWGYFTPLSGVSSSLLITGVWAHLVRFNFGLLQDMETPQVSPGFPNVKQREVSTCWVCRFLDGDSPEDTGMPWGSGFPLQIWGWDVSDHQSCSIRRGSGFLGNISSLYMFLQLFEYTTYKDVLVFFFEHLYLLVMYLDKFLQYLEIH